ncbi:hypothetical protein O6H91_21G013700 [Diphasiastrum complanatum]|nr:hypothetical protein O6H91_21G013700 [Diphasiastrum complanatum]
MLVLEGSVKKGQEIQAAMGSELRNLKNDRIKFQDRISLQIPAFKNIRSILDVTRQDVLKMKLGWQEEMDALEFKLEGITGAATRYYKVQAENRKLYNTIEELKGKIRVYCRVRPIRSETKGIVDFIGENGDILINNPNKQGREGSKLFNFNKVYRASASQGEVFLDSQQLIRSTLDGFNVCIFAYGQTGSGKTYTMTGPSTGLEEDWGINYRSLNDLFQTSYSRKDAFAYEVGVQMMEIYNEHVRDLLVTDGNKKNLEIRNNSQQNGLHVPDANFVPVKSTEDVLELMKIGQKNRTVGATALNEHSSRSHSVLIVHVQGTDLASQSILRGRLHLVDLAGSERVDKSEVTGERLKEAQHINKSLSALGDVIAALAQKSVHVPYRNSKLTQLLQDSLGGQAKAVMFVHISQDSESYGETVSTLKFGERVASVELGAARSNRESWEIRELREQIASLQEALLRKDVEISKRDAEIERLQTLKAVRTSGTSHSLTSGKQRLKDLKLLTVERMSNSEADTQSVPKSLLEVMAYDEEAVSISTRQTHKGSLLLGPTCHKASEGDFEERTKNEDKLGLRRVMHKRSVSIDSQGSIASTISNKCTKNYTQRKVHRKLMLDREPSLKYWKDRPYMSSNILLASVNGKDQFHNRDDNDSPKVEMQYHGSNVVNSLPAQATPIISKSPSATWYSSRNMKPSPQKLSKLQLPEYPQGKHSATHESHETVRVHENSAPNGSIAALQCSSQTSDVQEDFEDKSTELSGLSHESDTDDSAVTSCEQLAPLVSDIHRTSQGAEKRTSRHRPIPRPPFRHIRKLANDEQPPASRWRRPSVMASGLSGARGVKASSSVGSRNPLKVTSKS